MQNSFVWLFVGIVMLALLQGCLAQSEITKIVSNTVQDVVVRNKQQEVQCYFNFNFKRTKVVLDIVCKEINKNEILKRQTYEFNITQDYSTEHYDSHKFILKAEPSAIGTMIAKMSTGLKWKISLLMQIDGKTVSVVEEFSQWELYTPYVLLLYSIIGLIVLPPFMKYYSNMIGFNLITLMSSLVLSASVLQASFVVLYKHSQNFSESKQSKSDQLKRAVLAAAFSFICSLIQLIFRIRVLVKKIDLKYTSNNIRSVVLCGILAFVELLVYIYGQMHKDLFLQSVFAVGLIYYISCTLFKKNSHYSFRGVLSDCLGMLLFTLLSRIYPLFYLRMASWSSMTGSIIMIITIQAYSLTALIMRTIINPPTQQQTNHQQLKKFIKMGGKSQKMDEMMEESSSQSERKRGGEVELELEVKEYKNIREGVNSDIKLNKQIYN